MDKLDKVLGSEETLLPSSGFVASVMQRVHEEAVAPPPIPFPWKRAIPGMVVAAVVFLWVAVQGTRQVFDAAKSGFTSAALPHLQMPAWLPLNPQQAGWLAVSLALALASWIATQRLAGRSGLF